nr:MAG TPA: hypothetical protein [Caudoviricetes sp.]
MILLGDFYHRHKSSDKTIIHCFQHATDSDFLSCFYICYNCSRYVIW